MARDLPTGERVYRAVKAELLSGAYGPGERIDAALLAERHMTSITPVRAALHRLMGEQLIEARAGEGFRVPQVSESGLRDLYAWNGQIMLLACRLCARAAHSRGEPTQPEDRAAIQQESPTTAAIRFVEIGERSGNELCARAIAHLNDQLNQARRVEVELINDMDDELAGLAGAIRLGRWAEVRHPLAAYHRRRIRLAADLVRLMRRRR